MAEAFNIHFSKIANKLSNFLRSRKDESAIFSIPSLRGRDVVSYLLKIDSNKSTGIDDISSRMLKLAAPFIAPSIARLINLSFSLNVFPSRWKTAKVTPIFKSGDAADVSLIVARVKFEPESSSSHESSSSQFFFHIFFSNNIVWLIVIEVTNKTR